MTRVKKTLAVIAVIALIVIAALGGLAFGRWSVLGGSTVPEMPETSADAESLRWLDHADVIADFKNQVEQQHDTRFVSQFAFSTAHAVGLADTPEVRALVEKHGERHLEGTTDIVSSREHERLLGVASIYVHQYNILLLLYLREHPNT
jgi:hypothetical protein